MKTKKSLGITWKLCQGDQLIHQKPTISNQVHATQIVGSVFVPGHNNRGQARETALLRWKATFPQVVLVTIF